MPIFLAVLMTRQAISPRFAMRILSNTVWLHRGEIACVRFAHHAIWLRRNDRCAAVVAAVGDQDFGEHHQCLVQMGKRSEAPVKPPPRIRLRRANGGRPSGAGAKRLGGSITEECCRACATGSR